MTQLLSYSGLPRETNQDWFDENDEEIKEMVNASRKESSSQNLPTRPIICSQKAAFTNIRRTVGLQIRLRKVQDSWLAAKADAISDIR